MRSSGGVATLAEAAAHPGGRAASRAGGGRRRRRRASRALAGDRERDLVRHGRHLDRRLPDRRRRARRATRERDVGGLAAAAADGRPAHGRRRRRLDRLARRGRCAARRARERGRRSGPACYGRGGDAADGDRREPPARAAAARGSPAGSSSTATRPSARSPGSTRPTVDRGRERRDAAGAARRLGRAGPRPARLRARRLRRRRAAARVRAGRGARDARPCSCPAAAGVLSALGLVACDERRDRGALVRLPARRRRASCRPRARPTSATAGQSFELTVPLQARARRQRSTARTRSATATPTASRAIELVAVRTAEVRPGPRLELPRGASRSRSTGPARASSSTAPPAGFPRGGWGLGMGPVARCGSRAVTNVRAVNEHRAPGHRQPPCARSRRRWAPCSSARPSPRTSRSGATARPRSSTRAAA